MNILVNVKFAFAYVPFLKFKKTTPPHQPTYDEGKDLRNLPATFTLCVF